MSATALQGSAAEPMGCRGREEGRWNIFKAGVAVTGILMLNVMMWIFPLIYELLLLLCTAAMQVAFGDFC